MKIKTITCHNVYNAGASLQAYALATYLQSLGHEVEIIDYVPDYLVHYRLSGVANPAYDKPVARELYNLAKLPGRLRARYGRRKKAFDQFSARYLPLTERHYSSYAELLENPPEADVFFAGSDQIWNTLFQNGKDPAFYLQFAPAGSIRASYAASFATQTIAPQYQTQTMEWLKELDHISVREASALEILAELGISCGVAVADPVFLLSQQEWEELCPDKSTGEPYVLVYDFDGNPGIRQAAQTLAAAHKLKIYTLQKLDYGDRCVADAGPIEFVQLIRGASYVLSNSFHATAFSLLFHRPFFAFDREEGINTRMRDLISRVNLEARVRPEDPIPWNPVQQKLDEYIAFSKEYIHSILKTEQVI